MSKTDKTAPLWVKLRRHDLVTEEYHDHRDGVCNLKADPGLTKFFASGCCHTFRYTGTAVCCCSMCHAVEPPRTETQRRRRERRTGKQRTRQHWLDEYDTDPRVAVPDDECPRDHRPCPFDEGLCCTTFREES